MAEMTARERAAGRVQAALEVRWVQAAEAAQAHMEHNGFGLHCPPRPTPDFTEQAAEMLDNEILSMAADRLVARLLR